ncbi:hypothetical protein LINPERHAP2_LOCUS41471 [Linum perenne]
MASNAIRARSEPDLHLLLLRCSTRRRTRRLSSTTINPSPKTTTTMAAITATSQGIATVRSGFLGEDLRLWYQNSRISVILLGIAAFSD